MQPFKMLVGDMVNEKQKGLAYSIQSFLCNSGSIVGYVFPFILTFIGFKNTAEEGVIPQTVVYSFYIGAAILLLCVIYSLIKIKEWPPQLYAEYNGIPQEEKSDKKQKSNLISLLINAPKTFWTVGLVQFFCWFSFLFMWTYTNGTVAKNAFDCPETYTINGISETYPNGDKAEFFAKYILKADSTVIVGNGKATVAGVDINGKYYPCKNVEITVSGEKSQLVGNSLIHSENGVAVAQFNDLQEYPAGTTATIDGKLTVDSVSTIEIKDYLSQMEKGSKIIIAGIVSHDPHTGEIFIDEAAEGIIHNPADATYERSVVLNTESTQYNDAGNWVGILFAIQAIGSVLWAVVLPMFRSRKFSYSLSLLLGAAGFISAGFITNQYLLFVSFILIGCAWSAMLAWPFTILTNSLKGGNIGAYLGLFNCSICIPQIIGALAGGWILSLIGSPDQLAPQSTMIVIAGISLIIGAICVSFIREGNHGTEN